MKTITTVAKFVILITSTGLAAAAAAAPPVPQPVVLQGDVMLDRTVTENGTEKHLYLEPKSVVPGDHLRFSTRYRNAGTTPVDHFVVTNPVPPAVVLAPDSAASLIVSVDGGTSWGQLAALRVADGKGGTRPAQAGDVTHVRWVLPVLQPGASGTVTYNAIVR